MKKGIPFFRTTTQDKDAGFIIDAEIYYDRDITVKFVSYKNWTTPISGSNSYYPPHFKFKSRQDFNKFFNLCKNVEKTMTSRYKHFKLSDLKSNEMVLSHL